MFFYSLLCKDCKDFEELLYKNQTLYNIFEKYEHGKHLFPSYIKGVPSIVVPGPNGKYGVLEYDNAFRWLEKMNARMTQGKGANSGVGTGGIMDYDPGVMGGGLSSTFTTLEGEQDGNIHEGTFLFLGDNTLGGSNLGQEIKDTMINNNSSKDQTEKKMKELQAERERLMKAQMQQNR